MALRDDDLRVVLEDPGGDVAAFRENTRPHSVSPDWRYHTGDRSRRSY